MKLRRGLVGQRLHETAGGVRIGEVVEVVDASARVHPIAHRLRPLGAAEHGRGVDDEIVILAVIEVGDERLEATPESGALDVAAENAEVRIGPDVGPVEHTNQRRFRHHRFETRQFLRVCPLLDHGGEQARERIEHDALPQPRNGLEDVQNYRKVFVESAAGERGPAGGTGDPHEPADHVALFIEQVAQIPKAGRVGRAAVALDDLQVSLVERTAADAVASRDEFADQTTT